MSLFFSSINLIIGILIILVGFKVLNPFSGKKDDNNKEEEEWYLKYGKLFKIGGTIVSIIGLFQFLTQLF